MSRAAIGTAVFFVVAPGTMAGLVPWLITRWADPRGGVLGVLGVALVLGGPGSGLSPVSPASSARAGGTPAPVASTEQLVVGGIYRFVRNPMYVGVRAIIGGQALLFGSPGRRSGRCVIPRNARRLS